MKRLVVEAVWCTVHGWTRREIAHHQDRDVDGVRDTLRHALKLTGATTAEDAYRAMVASGDIERHRRTLPTGGPPQSIVHVEAGDVIRAIGDSLGVPSHLILSPSRQREVTRARQVAIRALAHLDPSLSIVKIAHTMGLDHTTVMFALGRTPRVPSIDRHPMPDSVPPVRDPHPSRIWGRDPYG
jgi:chromosomal replication initiation ATPase DnaA